MGLIPTLAACHGPAKQCVGIISCRESTSVVKVFKSFKEVNSLRPGFSAEGIYGGTLLAVRTNDFICFYDWNTMKVCMSAWGAFSVFHCTATAVPQAKGEPVPLAIAQEHNTRHPPLIQFITVPIGIALIRVCPCH